MVKRVKCPKVFCNHEWDYKGNQLRATCSSCGSKVKVISIKGELN